MEPLLSMSNALNKKCAYVVASENKYNKCAGLEIRTGIALMTNFACLTTFNTFSFSPHKLKLLSWRFIKILVLMRINHLNSHFSDIFKLTCEIKLVIPNNSRLSQRGPSFICLYNTSYILYLLEGRTVSKWS